MLMWMGFLGKVIDLLVTKIAGKRIDLALDEKKKAAKAFIRFHEAVAELENCLGAFIAYIETFVQDTNTKIFRVHLNERIMPRLERASPEFIRGFYDLGRVLHFYDPDLATLLARVQDGKGDILRYNIFVLFGLEIETHGGYGNFQPPFLGPAGPMDVHDAPVAKFEAVPNGKKFANIRYTIPSDKLMDLNLIEFYQKVMSDIRNSPEMDAYGSYENMPYEVLVEVLDLTDVVMNLIKANLEEGLIEYEQKDKMIALYPKLRAHKEMLTEARERLRSFIEEQFSLVDVLYVVKQ